MGLLHVIGKQTDPLAPTPENLKAIKAFPPISLIRVIGSDDLHDAIFDVNDAPEGGVVRRFWRECI